MGSKIGKHVRFALKNSSAIPCKHCNTVVELDLRKRVSNRQVVVCIILVLLTAGLFAWVPFVIPSCYDY